MKRTRLTVLLALVLIACMTATGSLTARAQEISDAIADLSGSAYSDAKTTCVITLYWDDGDNAYGTRPEEVTALLTANGGEFGSEYLRLNEDNRWENVNSLLPMYYFKGSSSGRISYEYEIFDMPDEYDVDIEQSGNWFKVTCRLKRAVRFGDVDCDDEVSIADAAMIQRYDIGMAVTAFSKEAGDVNDDQSIDILDTSVVQRFLAGYDCSCFSVGEVRFLVNC